MFIDLKKIIVYISLLTLTIVVNTDCVATNIDERTSLIHNTDANSILERQRESNWNENACSNLSNGFIMKGVKLYLKGSDDHSSPQDISNTLFLKTQMKKWQIPSAVPFCCGCFKKSLPCNSSNNFLRMLMPILNDISDNRNALNLLTFIPWEQSQRILNVLLDSKDADIRAIIKGCLEKTNTIKKNILGDYLLKLHCSFNNAYSSYFKQIQSELFTSHIDDFEIQILDDFVDINDLKNRLNPSPADEDTQNEKRLFDVCLLDGNIETVADNIYDSQEGFFLPEDSLNITKDAFRILMKHALEHINFDKAIQEKLFENRYDVIHEILKHSSQFVDDQYSTPNKRHFELGKVDELCSSHTFAGQFIAQHISQDVKNLITKHFSNEFGISLKAQGNFHFKNHLNITNLFGKTLEFLTNSFNEDPKMNQTKSRLSLEGAQQKQMLVQRASLRLKKGKK